MRLFRIFGRRVMDFENGIETSSPPDSGTSRFSGLPHACNCLEDLLKFELFPKPPLLQIPLIPIPIAVCKAFGSEADYFDAGGAK
jgi:hypothetical protein